MENKELSLIEIQKEMLNTMIKIDEICSLLNIKYSLAYGSLIGAIRHNGFIPWDDDMDIWMSKEDVNIFTEYCKTHSEEIKPFKLCCRENVKNYSYNIPRFANLDYKYVNTDDHQAEFDMGIFVDIYPIDNFGDTPVIAEKIAKKTCRLNSLYDIYINPNTQANISKTMVKKVIYIFLHLLHKSNYYKTQEEMYERIINKYIKKNSKYVGCVCWSLKKPILHKRSDVFDVDGKFDVIKHDFEGVKFSILRNYDIILRNSYGDYMVLPPENQRHPYHEYKIYKR